MRRMAQAARKRTREKRRLPVLLMAGGLHEVEQQPTLCVHQVSDVKF